jgi:hypothetical protein
MGRTFDLPELSGSQHNVREIPYHEFWRQAIGILLIGFYSLWSELPLVFKSITLSQFGPNACLRV